MNEYRYIGIFNYERDGLPMTRMISFDSEINTVINELMDHSTYNQNSLSNYHISEYESSWEANDKVPPVKIRQIEMSNYVV